jgi:hypothetical protein
MVNRLSLLAAEAESSEPRTRSRPNKKRLQTHAQNDRANRRAI